MGRATSPLKNRLIFVVGVRRSGTNWIQRILAAHPDVVGTVNETCLFSRGIRPLADRFHQGALDSRRIGGLFMDRDQLLDGLRDFCDSALGGLLDAFGPAERLVERTPEHVAVLDLMADVYPDAAIVHVIRDGRDVARSLYSQEWGPTTVELAAAEWQAGIEASRRAAPAIPRYREVRYEALLADTEREVVELYKWLDLPLSSQVLESVLCEAAVPYNADPKMPEIGSGKWRTLSGRQLATIDRVAGETLASLGYNAPSGDGSFLGRVSAHRRSGPSQMTSNRRRSTVQFEWPAADRQAACELVDGVLDHLAAGRYADLRAMLAPGMQVRILEPRGVWTGRGPAAIDHLIEVLAKDWVREGRQTRSEVIPAFPTYTILTAHARPDGSTEDRLLAVTLHDDEVVAVAYYLLPLAAVGSLAKANQPATTDSSSGLITDGQGPVDPPALTSAQQRDPTEAQLNAPRV